MRTDGPALASLRPVTVAAVLLGALAASAGCSAPDPVAAAPSTETGTAASPLPRAQAPGTDPVPLLVVGNETGLVDIPMTAEEGAQAFRFRLLGETAVGFANRDHGRTDGDRLRYGLLVWRDGLPQTGHGGANASQATPAQASRGLSPRDAPACQATAPIGLLYDSTVPASLDLGWSGSRLAPGDYGALAWSEGFQAPWTLDFGGDGPDGTATTIPAPWQAPNASLYDVYGTAHGSLPLGTRNGTRIVLATIDGTRPAASDGDWMRRLLLESAPTGPDVPESARSDDGPCNALGDAGRDALPALPGANGPPPRRLAALGDVASLAYDLETGPPSLPATGPMHWRMHVFVFDPVDPA